MHVLPSHPSKCTFLSYLIKLYIQNLHVYNSMRCPENSTKLVQHHMWFFLSSSAQCEQLQTHGLQYVLQASEIYSIPRFIRVNILPSFFSICRVRV
jgi:hypothetical protein